MKIITCFGRTNELWVLQMCNVYLSNDLQSYKALNESTARWHLKEPWSPSPRSLSLTLVQTIRSFSFRGNRITLLYQISYLTLKMEGQYDRQGQTSWSHMRPRFQSICLILILDNRTTLGWDIPNSTSDLEKASSRSWLKSNTIDKF